MAEKKKNKEAVSIKLDPDFKKEIQTAIQTEGISFTALVERELGRYLRAYKKACLDVRRKREIEKELRDARNGT
jgi:hypothetical protein